MSKPMPKQLHSFCQRPGQPKRCAKCDHAFAEHKWQYVVGEDGKGKQVAIDLQAKNAGPALKEMFGAMPDLVAIEEKRK